MKTTTTKRASLDSYSNSVEELRELLLSVPENATFNLAHHAGDRPFDSDSFSITFEWEEPTS